MTATTTATFHIPAEVVDAHLDWTECVAYRFVKIDDETVRLEVTNNLDRITTPEAS